MTSPYLTHKVVKYIEEAFIIRDVIETLNEIVGRVESEEHPFTLSTTA